MYSSKVGNQLFIVYSYTLLSFENYIDVWKNKSKRCLSNYYSSYKCFFMDASTCCSLFYTPWTFD